MCESLKLANDVSAQIAHWFNMGNLNNYVTRCGIYKQSNMAEVNFDLGFPIESDEDEEDKAPNSKENEGEQKKNRFGSSTSKDKEEIMDDRHKENPQQATKNCVKILTDYLQEKQLKPLNELENKELPDILLDFYCNLRKAKGGNYKLQTLKCI